MSLMSYTSHTSVTIKGMLHNLKNFAVSSCSWTNEEYQTSVGWDKSSPYTGWEAGTGDFLVLSTTGWGSQNIYAYFYAQDNGSDSQEALLYNCPALTDAYATNSYNEPWNQTSATAGPNWQTDSEKKQLSLPPTSQTFDTWFFGTSKYIYVVIELPTDPLTYCAFHFGTIDLYSEFQSRSDMQFHGWGHDWQSGWSEWYELPTAYATYWFTPLGSEDSVARRIYYDGSARYANDCVWNLYPRCRTQVTDWWGTEDGNFAYMKRVPSKINYCDKHLLIKPTCFLQDPSAGTWFPIGTSPMYVIQFAGLTPGEDIVEGSETFRCFPCLTLGDYYGIAFRIA